MKGYKTQIIACELARLLGKNRLLTPHDMGQDRFNIQACIKYLRRESIPYPHF